MSDSPATIDLPVSKRSIWFWFRIVLSTFFALLTVALCVLWVRSYWRMDFIRYYPRETSILNELQSNYGYLRFLQVDDRRSLISITLWMRGGGEAYGYVPSSWCAKDRMATFVYIPFSIPVTITASLAALLYGSTRFSLRTLLIATTLLAIVLGLMVCAVRS